MYDNQDIHFILKLVIPFFRRIVAGLLFQDSVDRDIQAMHAMYTMKDQQIRAVLDEHWAASAAGDLEKEHDIYADNVVVDYPQSMERISGRQNIQALRGHHPSKPSGFKVRRIIGRGTYGSPSM